METQFHWIDGTILIVYLTSLTLIGIWFSKRQKSIDDFFLAKRGMSWIPIGLSLMAALNSGIDYLTQPSAVMRYGYLLVVIPSVLWIVLYLYVSRITLPFYRRLQVYSAYEYLERRFDVRVRTLSAIIFVLWRIGWMGTALYVPCLAINSVTGGALPLVPTVIVLGSVATLYCMLGGFKAVVWTEVTQFCIMFAGIVTTITVILSKLSGNFVDVFRLSAEYGRLGLTSTAPAIASEGFFGKIFDIMHTDISFFSLGLAMLIFRMTSYTADQVMVQRLEASKSVREAKRSFVINAVSDCIWMLCLGFVGLALFSYIKQTGAYADIPRDKIFPIFIAEFFPVGVTGLVIAAIFAASLSSVDAAINSTSSVVIVDLYDRLVLGRMKPGANKSERVQKKQVLISRIFTIVIGVVAIVLAANVGRIGELYEIMNKVIGLFVGPLFGLFLLGMFSRRATSMGVLIGGVLGAVLTIYTAFFSQVSFIYTTTLGLLFTVLIGYLSSLLLGKNTETNIQCMYRQVMKLPKESVT